MGKRSIQKGRIQFCPLPDLKVLSVTNGGGGGEGDLLIGYFRYIKIKLDSEY